mgnify:FL=1
MHLKARQQTKEDFLSTGIVPDKDSHFLDFKLEQVPLDMLVQNQKPNEKVVEKLIFDIVDNGLNYPLIVHEYHSDYKDRLKNDSNLTMWTELFGDMTEGYLVFTGNCRLEAARMLGYDSIDCAVFSDYRWNSIRFCTDICEIDRMAWNGNK